MCGKNYVLLRVYSVLCCDKVTHHKIQLELLTSKLQMLGFGLLTGSGVQILGDFGRNTSIFFNTFYLPTHSFSLIMKVYII